MVFKNSLKYLVFKGGPAVVNFISIIIFSRLVSPSAYGEYSLLLATVTFLNSICFQWIRLSLLRYLPSSSNKDEVVSTLLFSFFLSSFICIGILLILSGVFQIPISFDLIIIGSIILILKGWLEFNLQLFTADIKPGRYGVLLSIRTSSFLLFGVLLIMLGFSGNSLIIALLLSLVLSAIISLGTLRKMKFKLVERINIIKYLKYGIPLTLSSSMIFIVNYSDRYFIEYFLSTSDVGAYSITYDFAQSSILNLMMIINLAAYPIAVKKFDQFGHKATSKFLFKTLKIMLLLILPLIAVLIAAPGLVSSIIFGSEYTKASVLLMPLISVSIMMKGLSQYYFYNSFYLTKKTKKQMYVGAGIALLNVFFNYLLIPQYGVIGAVYSTLISFLTGLVLTIIWTRKDLNLSVPFLTFVKLSIPFLLVCIIIHYSKNMFSGIVGFILIFAIAYISYVLISFLLKDSLFMVVGRKLLGKNG